MCVQIPFSSDSPELTRMIQGKRLVLALTKADLVPKPELEVRLPFVCARTQHVDQEYPENCHINAKMIA